MKRHIPNTITMLNLVSGFAAVIMAAEGKITIASLLIIAAMVFDFFDGFAARALKAYSDIGKELDSLADLVSFGVAPAFIIYRQVSSALLLHPEIGNNEALIYTWIAAIMPAAAALRLAVFNTDSTQSTSFRGLPTPANALAVVSLVLSSVWFGSSITVWLLSYPPALAALTVVLSVLMVTRLPLASLKFRSLRFGENADRYAIIACTVLLLAASKAGGMAFIIPAYIIVSLLFAAFRRG